MMTLDRETLRAIVDKTWNEATESTEVPSTQWSDEIIDAVLTSRELKDGDVPADTGNIEADRVISRLCSSDPDFDDCTDAAVLIRKLVAENKGPDGFATWKDAATDERMKRVTSREAKGSYADAYDAGFKVGLAARDDEKPVAYRYALETGKWTVFLSHARAKFLTDEGATVEPLFTHPAAQEAAKPIVPDEEPKGCPDGVTPTFRYGYRSGWLACRKAMIDAMQDGNKA